MNDVAREGPQSALLLLGCPQVPVQTGIALYLVNALKKKGIKPVIAGNQAARVLIEVSDPDRHYIGEIIDLDRCIRELAEKKRDFNLCFVFIHNDAGVTYAATMQVLSAGAIIAVIYGEHSQEIADAIEFPCEKIAVKAVHNPMPLKKKIDEVLPWVVSNL
jgi:hypothetical protein